VSCYPYNEYQSSGFVKHAAITAISALRKVSTRMPLKILYLLSILISPFIFIFFTLPAKVLGKIKATRELAGKIPFNHGKNPLSFKGDIYDRLGAPIEHRFSKEEVLNMFSECGFDRISVTKLKDIAGWVAWGYKK